MSVQSVALASLTATYTDSEGEDGVEDERLQEENSNTPQGAAPHNAQVGRQPQARSGTSPISGGRSASHSPAVGKFAGSSDLPEAATKVQRLVSYFDDAVVSDDEGAAVAAPPPLLPPVPSSSSLMMASAAVATTVAERPEENGLPVAAATTGNATVTTVAAVAVVSVGGGAERRSPSSRLGELVSDNGGEAGDSYGVTIPPEPPGQCPTEQQNKIANLYKTMESGGLDMNMLIQQRKEFRNPSIYEKLIQFCSINELGTNYPPDRFDPFKWSKDSYYEELALVQKTEMDKLEKARKEKTKIEIVSGTAKRPNSSSSSAENADAKKRKRSVDKGHLDGFMADGVAPTLKNGHNSNMDFANQPVKQSSDVSNVVYTVGHYPPKLLHNLNAQRRENKFSDVGLVAGGRVIRAHRSVLAASSAYFNAMFTVGLVEEQQELVEIHSISPHILSQLVDFIYSGNVDITQDNVQELFAAADMLELDDVVAGCINYLKQQLHYSNALGIYRFAEVHNRLDLLETALRFIEANFPQVCQEEEFLDLPKEHLVQFLSSDYIHIDTECQVFQAAYNWIVHDIPARRCYVFEILGHVRLRLCSLARLERIIIECKDASLIVALRSIQKDLVSNKGCLVPLHAQPRVCARKNILVIGGSKREHSADSWSRTAESTYETIEKYDIFTGVWSEVAPISIGRILPGVALLDGKVYVIGGELESCIIANCECYDPRDNVWTPIACMEEPRCDFGLCALDNSLYAFGGWVGEDIGGSIEIYDPITNTWTLEGYLPEPRFSMGVVAYEGLIYIVGGCTHNSRHRQDVMCYNPVTKEWNYLAPMITPRSQMGITILDGYMYVVGGTSKNQKVLPSVERYSFEKNKWSAVAPMSMGRFYPAVAAADSRLYVIGGDQSQEINFYRTQITISAVECYDPHTNKWHECASLPSSRGEATAIVAPF